RSTPELFSNEPEIVLPEMLTASPATVLSLVKEKTVPVTPFASEAVIENVAPPQTVCDAGNAPAEVSGFTVTLKVTAPARFVHPPKIGVMVNVVVCGVLVKLVRLPDITVPDPSGIPEIFALVRV